MEAIGLLGGISLEIISRIVYDMFLEFANIGERFSQCQIPGMRKIDHTHHESEL